MKQTRTHLSALLSLMLSLLMLAAMVPQAAFAVELQEFEEPVLAEAYAELTGGQYYLKNKSTGTYLTVADGKAVNGSNVGLAAKKNSNAFQFGIVGNVSNGYLLTSMINSKYVVNPYADKPANGTNVTLYTQSNDGTQQWHFEEASGGYILHNNYNKNLVLTASGTNVKIATNSKADTQIWVMEKVSNNFVSIKSGNYFLKNAATGTYLSVDGAKTANGQNLSVAGKKDTNAYKFAVSGNISNGYYLGTLLNTGYSVNPYSDTPADGTNVTLYKKTADGTQQWHFEQAEGGYIIHNNYNKNLVLTVSGTNVKIAKANNTTSQLWTLETVETKQAEYTPISDGIYWICNAKVYGCTAATKAENAAALSDTLDVPGSTKNSRFHITGSAENGYLICTMLNESYVINPYSDTPGNGTAVNIYRRSGDNTQSWYFERSGDGYVIHNRYAPNSVLTLKNGKYSLAAPDGSEEQLWILHCLSEPENEGEELPAEDEEDPVLPEPEDPASDLIVGAENFIWGVDNWNFDNYDGIFTIDEDIRSQLIRENHLSSHDKAMLAEFERVCFFSGGSCYGFSATMALWKNGLLDVSRYGGSSTPYASAKNSKTTSLINFYQASQCFGDYNQAQRAEAFDAEAISQREILSGIIEHFNNSSEVLNICYGVYDDYGNMEGGHSVLCYGYATLNSMNDGLGYYCEATGRYYDCMLLLADSNFLTEPDYIDRNIFFSSEDFSWVVPYWGNVFWNSNEKNHAFIDGVYAHNGTSAIKAYGAVPTHYLSGITMYETSSADYSIQSVSSGNALYNACGNEIAPVKRYMALGGGSKAEEFALWNPTKCYTLSYESNENFDLTMDYENVTYLARAENSSFIQFAPEGELLMKGSNMRYDLSLVTEDTISVTDWYAMEVIGSGTDELCYSVTKDGYLLRSAALNGITVNATGDTASPTVTFSTDAAEVLIYEIDVNTIGIAVDNDGDGTFETTIAQSERTGTLGDMDGDGKINASDAAKILIAAAEEGASGTCPLDAAQQKIADVNTDGKINASDAALILTYAAKAGAGFDGTLEEFLAGIA